MAGVIGALVGFSVLLAFGALVASRRLSEARDAQRKGNHSQGGARGGFRNSVKPADDEVVHGDEADENELLKLKALEAQSGGGGIEAAIRASAERKLYVNESARVAVQ
jgi:hypothetical protein